MTYINPASFTRRGSLARYRADRGGSHNLIDLSECTFELHTISDRIRRRLTSEEPLNIDRQSSSGFKRCQAHLIYDKRRGGTG